MTTSPVYGFLIFGSDECFIVLQPLQLVWRHSRKYETWQKTITSDGKKFPYHSLYYVSFNLLFNFLNCLISQHRETYTEPQKIIINKKYIILYSDFVRFQTLVVLCQSKTGFNSMRCVLSISTKWKQNM